MEKVMESHGILRVQKSTDLEELLIFQSIGVLNHLKSQPVLLALFPCHIVFAERLRDI